MTTRNKNEIAKATVTKFSTKGKEKARGNTPSDHIKELCKRLTDNQIELCFALKKFKESQSYQGLDYKKFSDYVESELPIKTSTAYEMIRVASEFGEFSSEVETNSLQKECEQYSFSQLSLLAKLPLELRTKWLPELPPTLSCRAMSKKIFELKASLQTTESTEKESIKTEKSTSKERVTSVPSTDIFSFPITLSSIEDFVRYKTELETAYEEYFSDQEASK